MNTKKNTFERVRMTNVNKRSSSSSLHLHQCKHMPSPYTYIPSKAFSLNSLPMGRKTRTSLTLKSHTLPSSPTHSLSSSSSEFEFRISISPRKSSATADELFYKGNLLPLSLSPRLSLVRSLLASSSTSSSSARDSSGSSADSHSSFCDSSRPSDADEDEFLRRPLNSGVVFGGEKEVKKVVNRKFSLSRFSAVFRKEGVKTRVEAEGSSIKRMSSTAKEVMRKYLKKVKPLYEKISQKQQQKGSTTTRTMSSTDLSLPLKTDIGSTKETDSGKEETNTTCLSHSFSGNLRYQRKKNHGFSCPSSMRSSPNHSGILYRNRFPSSNNGKDVCSSETSSMEELQSAIQGAIAHCKNSMVQDKGMVSCEN